MTFKMKYTIEVKHIPSKSLRRSGIPMTGGKPNFGVLHDTGNTGSTAAGNVNYYINSRNDMEASAHTFIDDKQIIECIPLTTGNPEKAWHVLYNRPEDNKMFGADSNDKAAGVELCYGGNINFAEAYKRYVWYNAYLAYKFGFAPTRFAGHHILDPGRKTDPVNALSRYGYTYTQLLKDIVNEYNACIGNGSTPAPEKPSVVNPKNYVIAKGDTLWAISKKYGITVDAIISMNPGLNPNSLQVGTKIVVGQTEAPKPVVPTPPPTTSTGNNAGKRVEAKVNLRYYSKPSWADKDVAGSCPKGYGFTIVDKVRVDGADQYKVKNSNGAIFYMTASPTYVIVK